MALRSDIGSQLRAGYHKTKHSTSSGVGYRNHYMTRYDVTNNVIAFENLLSQYDGNGSTEVKILLDSLRNLLSSLKA